MKTKVMEFLQTVFAPKLDKLVQEVRALKKEIVGMEAKINFLKAGDAEIKKRISAVGELSKIKMNLPSWKQLKKQDHRGISDTLESITNKIDSVNDKINQKIFNALEDLRKRMSSLEKKVNS